MRKLFVMFFILCMFGCHHDKNIDIIQSIICPKEIANKALLFAYKYKNSNTEYEWGGQDELRAIKIDCSGLVVNCYKYALNESIEYKLPFYDASVKDIFNNYSFLTDTPNPGDIIFMGEFNKNLPTHIAIYVKEENNNIYFIDSTKKEAVDGQPAINGVTERFYDKGDKRFKHFAKMKLLKK